MRSETVSFRALTALWLPMMSRKSAGMADMYYQQVTRRLSAERSVRGVIPTQSEAKGRNLALKVNAIRKSLPCAAPFRVAACPITSRTRNPA